jgi:hypothetical protein
MSHRNICRYYNTPQGCRRGENCTFSHGGKSSAPPSRSSGSTRKVPSAPQHATKAPSRVCDFFWRNGACKREFSCRFKHISPGAQEPTGGAALSAVDEVPPYLTESGLAKLTGTGTDLFFSTVKLSPSEAHTHLRKYLFDHFRFTKTFEVYAFVKILASATKANTSWVCSISSDNH